MGLAALKRWDLSQLERDATESLSIVRMALVGLQEVKTSDVGLNAAVRPTPR
jgi:hypothetical protein